MQLRMRRRVVAGLSLLGMAEALYMLAYQKGVIRSLACPFFGKGCEKVARSQHASHFGISNSAAGAATYAAMAGVALEAGGRTPYQAPAPAALLGGMTAAAVAASAFLTWEQKAKVKAWCFWCLTTAAINFLLLPLTARDGYHGLRALRRRLG